MIEPSSMTISFLLACTQRTSLFAIVILFTSFSFFGSQAQGKLFAVHGGGIGGTTDRRHFLQNRAILQNNFSNDNVSPYGANSDGYMGLQLLLKHHFAFEGCLQTSANSIAVHDQHYQTITQPVRLDVPDFYSKSRFDQGSFYSFRRSLGVNLSAYYYFHGFYFRSGIEYNIYVHPLKKFSCVNNSDDHLTMDMRYACHYFSPFAELGGGITPEMSPVLMVLYVKFNTSGIMMTGNYADFHNNTLIANDRVTETATKFTLGIKIGYRLARLSKENISRVNNHHYKNHVIKRPRSKKIKNKKKEPRPVNPDNVKTYRKEN